MFKRLRIVSSATRATPNDTAHPNGDFYVWLETDYVDRLRVMRKQGESYSDVILRLAEASEGGE